MKYICKKLSNQEMFAISLSSCSRYNANFKFDQSVFAIHDSPPYHRVDTYTELLLVYPLFVRVLGKLLDACI